MSDLPGFLTQVRACAGMSGLELNAFAAFLEPRRLPEGEVLFKEGEPGSLIFIVRSGLVGAYVLERDGSHREVYEFPPGSLFGEMAIAEGTVRSATAYAKEDSFLFALDAIDFYRLVWEHPALAVKLLGNMARNLAAWLDEAAGYLGDLARWGEDARRRALVDETTGLFNRRFLEETMRSRFGRGIDSIRSCALVALDFDHFREINVTHGSKAGDAVIAQAGASIGHIVAASGHEGAVAARLSGDEFSIFIPEAGPAEAKALAERIRGALEELFIEFRAGAAAEPSQVCLTTSIGCASAPENAASADELVRAADEALYRAKQGGRNRVACFDD
jgi:diguanylate cyclase (GGDEF)-like protein